MGKTIVLGRQVNGGIDIQPTAATVKRYVTFGIFKTILNKIVQVANQHTSSAAFFKLKPNFLEIFLRWVRTV